MTRYINISEQWGDAVEVTIEDYRQQAEAFGVSVDEIEERDDGIYIDGEQVAEAGKMTRDTSETLNTTQANWTATEWMTCWTAVVRGCGINMGRERYAAVKAELRSLQIQRAR